MIWGISGQARAGKDSVAERLVQRHGFVRVGWADPMKRFVQDLFAFTDEQVWSGETKDEPDPRYERPGLTGIGVGVKRRVEGVGYISVPCLTPRYALQTLGTEWGRGCYPGIWVEYGVLVARRILSHGCLYTAKRGVQPDVMPWPAPLGVVFSDCRFRNEIEAVRAAGGVLVRVKRPGKDGSVGIEGHQSEAEMRSIPDSFFDHVIENDGTLDDLHRRVDEIVGQAQRAEKTKG